MSSLAWNSPCAFRCDGSEKDFNLFNYACTSGKLSKRFLIQMYNMGSKQLRKSEMYSSSWVFVFFFVLNTLHQQCPHHLVLGSMFTEFFLEILSFLPIILFSNRRGGVEYFYFKPVLLIYQNLTPVSIFLYENKQTNNNNKARKPQQLLLHIFRY